jgi:DNA primase
MSTLLERVIEQDQTLEGHGRWKRGSENSSLVVDCEKQIFYWNSKGVSGNVYIWLTKIKGFNHNEAKSYLSTQDDYEDTFIYEIRNTQEIITYPAIIDVFYQHGLLTDESYWKSRGFTDETIARFRLGYMDTHDGFGFWTLPIHEDGLFRQVQLRRDNPSKMIRKYYSTGKNYLFNSDILRLVDNIIITESPVSAVRVMQEGLPAMSHDGGSGYWDKDWINKFMYCKKITVLYDNDDAGIKGAKKVAKSLGEYRTKVYTFKDFPEHYGVDNFLNDEHTVEDLKELVKGSSKYIFEL